MWTLDKNKDHAAYGELTSAEQAKFETFENAIANHGKHPKDAADEAGDTHYKRFYGNLHQIRLSDCTRATFQVDDAHQALPRSALSELHPRSGLGLLTRL